MKQQTVSCRHYTPEAVARNLACSIRVSDPKGILDPTAGDGALLVAAAARFPNAAMLGMDIDADAARRLQKRVSGSTVSICDALERRSVARSGVWRYREQVDVVIANPPFGSLLGPRIKVVSVWGQRVQCGIAAAHVLAAVEFFSPREVVAVVPDSMLYSERDAAARSRLEEHYSIRLVRALGNAVFGTTDASVSIVELTRGGKASREPERDDGAKAIRTLGPVRVMRGGVPMHEAKEVTKGGRPLLHTTNLLDRGICRVVKPVGRGLVAGPLILLPRVGLPQEQHLRPVCLKEHQLSDCVIALVFPSETVAGSVYGRLLENFAELRACWRGTGAQYTTLKKLYECMKKFRIDVEEE